MSVGRWGGRAGWRCARGVTRHTSQGRRSRRIDPSSRLNSSFFASSARTGSPAWTLRCRADDAFCRHRRRRRPPLRTPLPTTPPTLRRHRRELPQLRPPASESAIRIICAEKFAVCENLICTGTCLQPVYLFLLLVFWGGAMGGKCGNLITFDVEAGNQKDRKQSSR